MRISHALITVMAMVLLPPDVRAQDTRQRTLLDDAETLIGAGELSEARVTLERWRRQNPNAPRIDQEQQARYHLLSARLTTDADSAEEAYLTVAVEYASTRYAPHALLRLAQARHARGDSPRAINYLQRLLNDYPSTDQRAWATIWLARVQPAGAGNTALLCAALRGVNPGTNPEVIEHLKNETTRACGAPAVVAKAPAPQPSRPQPRPTPKPDTAARKQDVRVATSDTATRKQDVRAVKADTTRKPSPTTPTDTTARRPITPAPTTTPPPITAPTPTNTPAPVNAGRVSIQVGAFREYTGADEVRTQLLRRGFADVRLVRVPGNNLIRVRVGRFINRAAAESTLARLAAADISAVLVTDADVEQPVRN